MVGAVRPVVDQPGAKPGAVVPEMDGAPGLAAAAVSTSGRSQGWGPVPATVRSAPALRPSMSRFESIPSGECPTAARDEGARPAQAQLLTVEGGEDDGVTRRVVAEGARHGKQGGHAGRVVVRAPGYR